MNDGWNMARIATAQEAPMLEFIAEGLPGAVLGLAIGVVLLVMRGLR